MYGVHALHTSNFFDFRDCQNAFVGVIDLLVSGSKYNQVFRLVIKFDIFSRSKLLSPTETEQYWSLELSYWVHVQPQSSNWVDLISRLSYCWHVYFFHQLPLFISWYLDLVSKSGCFFTWRWVHNILHKHRIISVWNSKSFKQRWWDTVGLLVKV